MPGEDLTRVDLPAPVLPQQAVHLARFELEDPIQGGDSREVLTDPRHAKERRGLGFSRRSRGTLFQQGR